MTSSISYSLIGILSCKREADAAAPSPSPAKRGSWLQMLSPRAPIQLGERRSPKRTYQQMTGEQQDGQDGASTSVASSHEEDAQQPPPKSSKKTNIKETRPCRVCGILYEDMPKKGLECWEHQRDVAGLQKSLEVNFANNPSAEAKKQLDDYKVMRKSAGAPPTEFSTEVLKYGQSCPTRGRGTSRGNYTSFRQTEESNSITQAAAGMRCTKMHKERFMKWAVDDYVAPAQYAKDGWYLMNDNYDMKGKNQVDHAGPTFSKLQFGHSH